MYRFSIRTLALLVLISCQVYGAAAEQLAFPGAEGFGAQATGGRGGRVIAVTNLNDSGSGSLREAIDAQGPRIVVFRVSGTIALKSSLKLKNSDLTIAGQTAPGGGICLKNYSLDLAGANNVIIRYLRVRPGSSSGLGLDALGGRDGENIIIDHCSMSWSVDECVSIYSGARNITVQWCLMSESLSQSVHTKGRHGYGGIWGGQNASWHHNLLAHHSSRNPRIVGRSVGDQFVDMRNNVIFNWGHNSCYGGDGDVRVNVINNYYKPGPATRENIRARVANPAKGKDPHNWWIAGNLVVGSPEVTADNWLGVHPSRTEVADVRAPAPFAAAPVTTHSADEAFALVLEQAGATLPRRDSLDARIVEETRTGAVRFGGTYDGGGNKGIIDTPETVGGWPELESLPAPVDTDGDGMPDAWEKQFGLDANRASDGSLDKDNDGYTNVEEYLNNTDPTVFVDYTQTGRPRHRIVVSTDIGGSDPDDFQSMVHLLVYADVFDIEGLISSAANGQGLKKDILDVIDCYEKDYTNLRTYSDRYPSAAALRGITKQGETETVPYPGVQRPTEGSEWIIACARRDDPRPLHLLVWGGLEDLAQALHDAPDILPKLRVYWIGGPNKKWSPHAYQYLADHHPTLWFIESNAAYRGWFVGGTQSGQWGNEAFVAQHVAGKGALGDFFVSKKDDVKMGDTPSVGWLLKGTPADPTQPGWGGRYVRAWDRPYLRLQRMPRAEDRLEIFGILELVLPVGYNVPGNAEAFLRVDNQRLLGYAPGDGTLRFRFCPKSAKVFHFKVEGNVPALAGRTGSITVHLPTAELAERPSARFPNWWTDDPSPAFRDDGHDGAKTINRWREDFLGDFAARMRRCQSPASVETTPAGMLPRHWHESSGFGTDTKGGIAGDVYKVTHLNPSGPGSLQDAVSQSNRLVVFEVGGVIDMDGARLRIASNVTIAGQTAPYPGISVIKSNVNANGSDIVVSHINVHLGSKVGRHYDAFNVRGNNIVLDHVAVYWGMDETLPIAKSNNVTVYKCIIAEGLQFTGHGDGEHSKGLHIQEGNRSVSVIGSLGAHNALRNPRIDGGEAFLANYVLYNWGPGWDHKGPKVSSDDELPDCAECFNYAIHAHMNANVTLVGSVALSGEESRCEYFLNGHHGRSANGYLKDNIIKDREGKDLHMADPKIKRLASPAIWPDGAQPLPAEEALYEVLRTAGPQPGNRNVHNARLIQSVADGTGEIIDSEEEVGGYPNYPATNRSLTVPEGEAARQAWLDALEGEIAVDRSMNLSRLYNIVGSRASDRYAN